MTTRETGLLILALMTIGVLTMCSGKRNVCTAESCRPADGEVSEPAEATPGT